jgi:hypothetical protein
MLWHIACAAGMIVLAMKMIGKERSRRTRCMAAVPLGVALAEGLMAGAVPPLGGSALMSLLTALLLLLYAVIVCCCVWLIRMDAAAAAAKRLYRRKLSWQLRQSLYPLQALEDTPQAHNSERRADCA